MIDELACNTKAKQTMVYGKVDFGVVKCRQQSSIVRLGLGSMKKNNNSKCKVDLFVVIKILGNLAELELGIESGLLAHALFAIYID